MKKLPKIKKITRNDDGTFTAIDSYGRIYNEVQTSTGNKVTGVTVNGKTITLEYDGDELIKVGDTVVDGLDVIPAPVPDTEDKTVTYTENGSYEVNRSTGKYINKVNVTVNVPSSKEEITYAGTVTSNGLYEIDAPEGKVYNKIEATVNVQPPYGELEITENGTYDVKSYNLALVDVPNPSTGSLSITENGTYDVTEKASAVVNVQGGASGLPLEIASNCPSPFLLQQTNIASVLKYIFPSTSLSIGKEGSTPTETLLLHCDDFTDSGVNSLTLTNSNVTVDTTTKKFGTGSFLFNSTSDYITVPKDNFAFGNSPFTIDFWVYPNSLSGMMLDSWGGSRSAYSFAVLANSNGHLSFVYKPTNGNAVFVETSSSVLSTNAWQHIAITRDATNIYLFVNGVLVKTHATNETIQNPVNPIYIGRNYDSSYSSDRLNGYMDELRILNGVCAWSSDFSVPTAPHQSEEIFVGDTLSASLTPTIAEQAIINYQWQRLVNDEWVNIASATNSTYIVVSGDVQLRCRVTGGNNTEIDLTSNTLSVSSEVA